MRPSSILSLIIVLISLPAFNRAALHEVSTHNQQLTNNYRLPNETEPLHYAISLTTNVHTGERAFTGVVKIDLKVNEDTPEIVLHARKLKDIVASCQLTNSRSRAAVEELLVAYEPTFEFLRLKPKNSKLLFKANTLWTVTISYSGELRDDNSGFYMSEYRNKDGQTRYLASTMFQHLDARHAFPCYDEPAKRARFTITLHHAVSYTALSNMPVDEAKSKPGTTVFMTSLKMSTYIVAFVVSDYKWIERLADGVKYRVYSRPGTETQQEWALNNSIAIVEHLTEYCGIKYPLPKLDQVAVPNMKVGGMENWGLIIYTQDELLYNAIDSHSKPRITSIVTHEITHQWFGNLVTFNFETYLWLAEGFAQLFQFFIPNRAYPEWNLSTEFQDQFLVALGYDVGRRAMSYYPLSLHEIEQKDSYIVYFKAASVLHMFQHALGAKVFQQGLRHYLRDNQYKAVEEQQLFDAMQKSVAEANSTVPARIADIMASWTRQSGHPVLTVTRNYNDGSFTVKQHVEPGFKVEEDVRLWYVPFNYVVKSAPDFSDTKATHYLLKKPQTHVHDAKLANNDWLILNKQHTGFYRINYDARNWELIQESLHKQPDSIHAFNRMHLLADAKHFCIKGQLHCTRLLNSLTYLPNEEEYGPWSVAADIVDTLQRQLDSEEETAVFKHFTATLVSKLYAKLGTEAMADEPLSQKKLRGLVVKIACEADVESCLKDTRAKLRTFVENGTHIGAELQPIILCHGLRQSDDKDFDYIYNAMMKTEEHSLRSTYIAALACSNKRSRLRRLLMSSIDDANNLVAEERLEIVNKISKESELGLTTGIKFLRSNWRQFANLTANKTGEKNVNDALRELSSLVIKNKQSVQLLQLVEKIKNVSGLLDGLEQNMRANIETNRQWYIQNHGMLMDWLRKYQAKNVVLNK